MKSDGRRRLQGPPAIKGHLVRHELRSREGASESAERREKAGGRADRRGEGRKAGIICVGAARRGMTS